MIIVNEISKATHVTHGGVFHADEVMATAIIIMNEFVHASPNERGCYESVATYAEYDSKIKLYRCINSEELQNVNPDTIVFDIGNGKFDHHAQTKVYRSNGIPYTSAGLMWKEYGEAISQARGLSAPWLVDANIIEAIDARDNSVNITFTVENKYDSNGNVIGSNINPYTFSDMVIDMNPTSDKALNQNNIDCAFIDAVIMACKILDKIIDKLSFNSRNTYIVEKAINNAVEGKVAVLPFYMPWIGILNDMRQHPDESGNDYSSVKAAVFPSLRGGHQWVIERDVKLNISEYIGMKAEELKNYFPGATFIHPNGFTGGAVDCESTVNMILALLKEVE